MYMEDDNMPATQEQQLNRFDIDMKQAASELHAKKIGTSPKKNWRKALDEIDKEVEEET